jgi:hypothetical protein
MPFHVEAYPRLNLKAALTEVQRGHGHVFWRDQEGRFVGMGRVTLTAPDQMTVDLQLRGLPYLSHDHFHDVITFERITRNTGKVDVLTICRGCQQNREDIFFRKGTWLCRTCQELGYRSTILSTTVRESEKLAQIAALLFTGRPRKMRADKSRPYWPSAAGWS